MEDNTAEDNGLEVIRMERFILLIGNELFGKPLNVESWSFGIPSIWVWNILFWVLGILMVWFLAIKMEMSTSMEKNISPYSDDFSN